MNQRVNRKNSIEQEDVDIAASTTKKSYLNKNNSIIKHSKPVSESLSDPIACAGKISNNSATALDASLLPQDAGATATTDEADQTTCDAPERGFLNGVYHTNFTGLVKALRRGGGRLKTRFPPEPNGSLHIGHVRALHINFVTANYYAGSCSLRYDDSNPESAKQIYYDGIYENLNWLGYKPN